EQHADCDHRTEAAAPGLTRGIKQRHSGPRPSSAGCPCSCDKAAGANRAVFEKNIRRISEVAAMPVTQPEWPDGQIRRTAASLQPQLRSAVTISHTEYF